MKTFSLIIALGFSFTLFAQQQKPHESDIMYKKEVTRALDLREKQNQPLFSRGREITALLIEAVKNGEVKAYASDSLTQTIEKETFLKSLELPNTTPLIDTAYITDEWEKQQAIEQLLNYKPESYNPKDLYQMEIKENFLFDKQHSVMEHYIQSITIFIPADHAENIKGIQTPIASFDFADCRKLFSNNPKAIWYNPYNDQEHKNLADAFDLRLFSSYIIKISNPEDAYLVDVYGDGKQGIIAAEQAEMKLLEYESTLWEN